MAKNKYDKYECFDVMDKVLFFIEENLWKDFRIDLRLHGMVISYLDEIIKNSFDAYATNDLRIGKELIFKVVLYEDNGKAVIKIKDNGCGFLNQQKGSYFQRKEIKFHDKDDRYLGKNRIGLRLFSNAVINMGGDIKIKNRKDIGATIHVNLPIPCQSDDDDSDQLGEVKVCGSGLTV